MKVKGSEVTKTMLIWGYMFTLSVFLLVGAVVCAVLTYIGLPLFWGAVSCLGLFIIVMKLLLDIDKDFQTELQRGKEDEPKADEPDKKI